MSIGLLLITHDGIGSSLLQTMIGMFGSCPLRVESLSIPNDCDLAAAKAEAARLAAALDRGDGVLVLTDMFGSTPGRIAASLSREGDINVLAGVNLPMLVRVFNYAQLDLQQVTEKALEGGRNCVIACCPIPD
jgi:mannose PTS system EIIA component